MRIMIIGASRDPDKYGNRALRAYVERGHEVVPINATADEVQGLKAYPSVSDPKGPIDRAILYLPAHRGVDVLDALAQRGDVAELWVSPGAESDELLDKARSLGFDPIQACAIVDVQSRG
jgi:uncharacterized protein